MIAIFMGMALLRMDFLIPEYRLRGAVRELGAVLKQAKSKAASAGKDVYIVIDVPKLEYWLLAAFPKLKEDGSLPGPDDPPAVLEYEEVLKDHLPEGVEFIDVVLGPDQRISSGQATVRVSPYGISN